MTLKPNPNAPAISPSHGCEKCGNEDQEKLTPIMKTIPALYDPNGRQRRCGSICKECGHEWRYPDE